MSLWFKGVIGFLILFGLILGYVFLRPLPSGGPPFVDSAERISVDELVE